ncbi:hypothetical protein GUJ93_ZPchr0005g14251 [Zizania palustris]|uniref:non-specific serine/threonine protein kinase n=1 Tax=Zizania palustris TaxID=103762 RepID=A0A8J5VD19_ZIZPA|nr:hypothetical protein GUJ93_ZPchr0005g14251 [Zizania palustris]
MYLCFIMFSYATCQIFLFACRRVSGNGFTGKIPNFLGSLPNLVDVAFHGNSFEGPIPESLSNLTKLTTLQLGDIVNGSSSLAFISNMTSLSNLILRNCRISDNLGAVNFSMFAQLISLDLSFNNITGQIPQSILSLGNLRFLSLGNNSFTGMLPELISPSLKSIDFSYNQLTGSLPSWATQNNLQLNLVANNFFLGSADSSALPSGLKCLQRDTPCFRGSPEYYSFAVNCGANSSTRGSDDTIYDVDPSDLGAASYYVSSQTRWGVSNVGQYFSFSASDAKNIIYSPQHFQNSDDSKLFESARMSASSLRYYGLGLENGNYTVLLQFVEFAFPDTQTWQSLGRRVFNIYVQGHLKEKNFDIRKTAGGKSFTTVNRSYTTIVSENFLEIHLFWAGKGSPRIPTEGYYGPMISAISVSPNFTPTVRNGGKLPDGRDIAVKQLSQSSHQGKSEFVTEVETISAVQHRNLVKLHGFCIDGKTPLLVYEYLENGSLDRALFGNSSLILDWAMRFEIILGIARGLTYLHEESSVRIVHRDIKAGNVLLDTNLTPKISDFGLAKLYDESQTHVSTKIAGTMGYVAPEYAMRGRLTEKADIFAFGVVMLEIVAGRPNTNNSLEEGKIYLFEWLWSLYEKAQALGIVDPNLNEFNKVEAFRVICVALLCTQGSPHQRPPMSKVVAMLTGEAEVAQVVTKPSYINEWLLKGGNQSYVTCSYSGFTSSDVSTSKESKHLTTGAGHG